MKDGQIKKYIQYSILFHIVVILFFMIAMKYSPNTQLNMNNLMQVEFEIEAATIANQTNIPEKKVENTKKENKKKHKENIEDKKDKKIKEEKQQKEKSIKEDKKQNKIDKPLEKIKENKKDPKKEKQVNNDFENMLNKIEKKQKEKSEQKKDKPKEVEKDNKDNKKDSKKEKQDEKFDKKDIKTKNDKKGSENGNDNDELTATKEQFLVNFIMQSIYPYWSIPAGLKNYENLIVHIEVKIINGSQLDENSIQIVDMAQYNNNPAFRIMADSTIRAFKQACPISLPYKTEFDKMSLYFAPDNLSL